MAITKEKALFQQIESWLPVSLALHAEKNNFIEELKLYLALKLSFSGKTKAKSTLLRQVKSTLGIGSRTTFLKRLGALKKMNWIGFNSNSGFFFIRSYERVCSDLGIPSRTCVEFNVNYFKNFRVFVFASIIGHKIKAMEYAKKRSKGGVKFVPQYWDGTNPNSPPPLLNYNGLPSSYIGKLIGKSKSRSSELKKLAVEAKFMLTKKKLLTVDTLPYSPVIREVLREKYPEKFGRFKIKAIKRGPNKGKVKIVEQLTDEIIPLLRYRKRRW